jgi:GDSL-like Lipase/Acylhydrolase family
MINYSRINNRSNINWVFDGNSLYFYNAYPSFSYYLAQSHIVEAGDVVYSYAQPGQSWQTMLSLHTDIDNSYNPNASMNILIAAEGSNQLTNYTQSVEQAWQYTVDYVQSIKSNNPNWTVVVPNILPARRYADDEAKNDSFNQRIDQWNALAQTNYKAAGIDLLIDYRFDGSPFEGSTIEDFNSNADLFSSDKLHLTAEGMQLAVDIIVDQVKVLPSVPSFQIELDFNQDPGQAFSWDGSQGALVVTGGVLSAIDPAATGLTRSAVFTPSLGAYANLETPSIAYSADFLQSHSSLVTGPAVLELDVAFDFVEAIVLNNAGVYLEDDVLTIGVVVDEIYAEEFDFSGMVLDINIGGATRQFAFDAVVDPISLGYNASQSVLAFEYQVTACDWDKNGIAIKAAHGVVDAAGHIWVVGVEQVVAGSYQVLG